MRELMDFHFTGPQGVWRLKSSVAPPTREEILETVTPEQVVLAEAALVGAQRLQDAGYGSADLYDEGESLEEQLAPWKTTRSFVSAATKGKMMKLHGEGDPTGRGEGFNFIPALGTAPFVKASDEPEALGQCEQPLIAGVTVCRRAFSAKLNLKTQKALKFTVVQQQQAYREEVDRIWKAQHDSLSNPIPPTVPEEEPSSGDSSNVSSTARKVLEIRRLVGLSAGA